MGPAKAPPPSSREKSVAIDDIVSRTAALYYRWWGEDADVEYDYDSDDNEVPVAVFFDEDPLTNAHFRLKSIENLFLEYSETLRK